MDFLIIFTNIIPRYVLLVSFSTPFLSTIFHLLLLSNSPDNTGSPCSVHIPHYQLYKLHSHFSENPSQLWALFYFIVADHFHLHIVEIAPLLIHLTRLNGLHFTLSHLRGKQFAWLLEFSQISLFLFQLWSITWYLDLPFICGCQFSQTTKPVIKMRIGEYVPGILKKSWFFINANRRKKDWLIFYLY